MRRVHRQPLSEATLEVLCERTCEVANAGNQRKKIGERSGARKREADRLWNTRRNKAFDEIRDVLRRMSPGNALCMYCEISAGSDIEHFWPKEMFPGRAYTWENYLWACAPCNSHHKRTQFPRDARGAPLMINPAEEDPREHLDFSPATGKYVARTPKGDATISVLAFDRRSNLDQARRDAWRGVQALIAAYAACCSRNDAAGATEMQRLICRHPFAAALLFLLDLLDTPRGSELVDQAVLVAIEAHPEIRTWP